MPRAMIKMNEPRRMTVDYVLTLKLVILLLLECSSFTAGGSTYELVSITGP